MIKRGFEELYQILSSPEAKEGISTREMWCRCLSPMFGRRSCAVKLIRMELESAPTTYIRLPNLTHSLPIFLPYADLAIVPFLSSPILPSHLHISYLFYLFVVGYRCNGGDKM